MKNLLYLSTLFFAILLFSGCPYTSEVAIDSTPEIKIDEKLLGKWESKSSTDTEYKVSKEDDKTYLIEKKSKELKDVTRYKGFLSEINGTRFLNIYEDIETATKAWYFYKVDVTGSAARITLSEVTENIDEEFHSSAELKDYFKKNMGLSFFYSKQEEVYYRLD